MTELSACLWFPHDVAARAVELYTGLIPDSRVVSYSPVRHPDQPEGLIHLWSLQIAGRPLRVMGCTGEEQFTHALAPWLMVRDQQELDRVWDGFLAAGGTELACGWIQDPFGVRWQVIPQVWERLVDQADEEQRQRVVEAVWSMRRIDVAQLEAAARA